MGRAFWKQQNLPARPHSPVLGAFCPRLCQDPAGRVTARWGTLPGLGGRSPSALTVFKTLKLIYLRAFLDAESIPQPLGRDQDGDRGPDISLLFPPGSHHSVQCRGTEGPQRTPQQHNPLPGVSWGSRASFPAWKSCRTGCEPGSTILPHAAISGAVDEIS